MAEPTEIHTFTDIEADFDAMFRAWYPALCRYALTILPTQPEAEDLVQQVFVKLWEKRESIEIASSPKAYLYRMVHNHCLNAMRNQRTKSTQPIDEQQHLTHASLSERSDEQLAGEELQLRIQRALQVLPTECRRIFELSRFEELKYREIAEQLQISVKTVEAQMGKALRLLRLELSDYLILCLIFIMYHAML